MENFIGKVQSINPNFHKGFDVVIIIYNENQLDLILDINRDTPFTINEFEYKILIYNNEMSHPDCESLNEIMEVYHKYEYSDNLNATLRRQWKIAQLIDNIAYKIISFGILKNFSNKSLENEE
jgi:hypothetical protein